MIAKRSMTTIGYGAATVLAAGLLMGLPSGCGNSNGNGSESEAAEAVVHNYTVRGRVAQLPEPEAMPPRDLQISHEAIEDFRGADGEVMENNGRRGMAAMTMPFPNVADEVSFEGIEVGDPIEFEFEVAWSGRAPNYTVTSVRELPADVELDLVGGSGGAGEPAAQP